MTNAEKNKDALRNTDGYFSVTKDNKIANCGQECIGTECQFFKNPVCMQSRVKWLAAEAKQTHQEAIKILDEASGRFGVHKDTGDIFDCTKNETRCSDCKFNHTQTLCADNRYKWLRENGFIKEE